jgi:tripartite-type tricarboxylate transporter receptor subunit TctC
MTRFLKIAALAAAVLAASPAAAQAQDYPNRIVTMIVPFPAGGATDTLARFLNEHLKTYLGQSIVVENVGGAAGRLAVAKAIRSAPDGYTLSIGTSTTHMLTGGLYQLPYDMVTDLEPIIMIGSEPLLIVGKKDLPPKDLEELIAWLKANPDKATVGVAGIGAVGHLTGIDFQRKTETKFQFVPYRGNGPAMQDLVAGQIDFQIEPSSNFIAQVQAGTIKAYATTGAARPTSFPQVPIAKEAGLPGFEATLWYGLWVPKDTPKPVIAKLNEAMMKTLAEPPVQSRFAELGIVMTPVAQQKPEALRAHQKAEADRWYPIIKAANIKAE